MNQRAFSSDDDNLGLLPAGAYTLTVAGSGAYTGSYAFNLLSFANATPITLGTPVNATLNPANSAQVYQFSGTAGQVLYFKNTSFWGDGHVGLRWLFHVDVLFDQYGQQSLNSSLQFDGGRIKLANTGTYTLAVQGYIVENGITNYSFNVTASTDATTALTLNADVSGSVATAGQNQNYTFTLGAPTPLLFDSQTYNGGLNWTLTGPNVELSRLQSSSVMTTIISVCCPCRRVYIDGRWRLPASRGITHSNCSLSRIRHRSGAANAVTTLEDNALHVHHGELWLHRSERQSRQQPAGREDHDAADRRNVERQWDGRDARPTYFRFGYHRQQAGVSTPAANANGTAYSSFTFQVEDDGGTANGGVNLDLSAKAMTINVTSVNDAPIGTIATVTTLEDTAYTFTTADFGFTDPGDSPANNLLAVKITLLPTAGTLKDNPEPLSHSASLSRSQTSAVINWSSHRRRTLTGRAIPALYIPGSRRWRDGDQRRSGTSILRRRR